MSTGALLAGFDAAEWAARPLFARGATTVTAPSVATLHDGGHYPDAVAFLNGWSAYQDLTDQLAEWTVTGTVSVYLTDAGLLAIDIAGALGEWLVAPAGASDPWGWGGTVHSTPRTGGQTLIATRAYTPGLLVAGTSTLCTVWAAAGGGEFDLMQFPQNLQRVQSLPHLLGIGDADLVSETMEKWDNAANDSTLRRIRWGLDAEGRVWSSYPATINPSPIGNFSWTSTTLRTALGFTGGETETETDGLRTIVGTYPARGVLVLRHGMAVRDGALHRRATAADTCGGGVIGRQVSHWRDLIVTASLRGGFGFTPSLAECRDEVEIYRATVWPYLWPGQRVTVCPDWSEARMGTTRHEAFAAGSASQPGNWAGASGRRRCVVSSAAPDVHALQWPRTAGARIMTAPLTWTLRELA